MITPANNKILVSVNMKQKDTIKIGDIEVSMALKFENNFREKSPTVACVVHGNAYVKEGDILLCHHNTFYTPSPYHLYDNLFSIPANGNLLFMRLDDQGEAKPIFGNLVCERVKVETAIPLPPEKVRTYIDRATVIDPGLTRYKKGQLIFHRPSAGYDIVYLFNRVEKRVTKVPDWQVCCVVSNF